MLHGDSLILLELLKVVFTTYFILSRRFFNQDQYCLGSVIICVFCCY